jgi:hypothetical protein
MPEVKTILDRKLASLPEGDLIQILEFVQYLEWRKRTHTETDRLSTPHDRGDDPILGLFEGPPDMASRAEETLEQASSEHSAWTWKRKTQ